MKTVPFPDAVLDVSAGNTRIPQSEFVPDGQLAIVDQGKSLIAGYTNDLNSAVRSPAPLIIFGDHTRALKFVDFAFAMGADGVKVLQARDGFDPKYVYHYLRSRKIPSAGYSRHYKFLKQVAVPKPPLPEQHRIAAILDHADALRAKRRQVLAHLDSLTQSIFGEMFSEPHDQVTLEDALDTASAFTDGDWVESKDQDPHGKVRLTQLADLGDGRWLDKSSRFLTTQTAERLRCTYLAAGDILVARMPDPLGRACIFPGAKRPCVTVVDVCVIRADPEKHHPLWLAAAINSAAVRAQIARLATGTTRSRVSRRNLGKVLIPHIKLSQQQEFAECVTQVDIQRAAAERALTVDDELFASLQSRAFRGEL